VSLIHKLINSVWNEEDLPDHLKESINVPVHKTGGKTDCNNYRGISEQCGRVFRSSPITVIRYLVTGK
jgi:hypothetical protein